MLRRPEDHLELFIAEIYRTSFLKLGSDLVRVNLHFKVYIFLQLYLLHYTFLNYN